MTERYKILHPAFDTLAAAPASRKSTKSEGAKYGALRDVCGNLFTK